MTSPISRYPLHWPAGMPRATRRARPAFESGSFAKARDFLLDELRRHRATDVILSTNVELRRDGLPLAGQRQPHDLGVAVYFSRKGRPLCVACDRWEKVEDNLRAIADVIEAIRLIERRGTAEMVDAAFTGFAALPPGPAPEQWWIVLGISCLASTEDVTDAYRRLALQHHPDRGGSTEAMQRVNAAFEQFKRERGL